MSSSAQASSSLLTASVPGLILRLALPGMLAMTASSLAVLFDALILSRVSTALSAAASLSFPVLTCIQTIGFTLGMGAGSFVSRSIGSGDKPAAYRAASTALFAALLLSSILCAAGFFLSEPLVRLLGASEESAASASAYARYVLASGPMLCASLVLSSLLRGQGQILSNLLAFSLGAAISIALDLLLVGRLSLGVTGAGAAILAREAVTLLVLLLFILRSRAIVKPKLKAVSFCPQAIRDIMQSGLPTLLRQGLMSVSSALLTRAGAAFGKAALSGMGLTVRICALFSSAVIGFGQGFQPVCGAAFGAGNLPRVKSAYHFCLRCVVISAGIAGILVFRFARVLLALFAPQPEAAAFAISALRAQSAVFFAMGAVIVMNMLTQAMGLTVRASVIATSRQGFVLIPLIILLPRLFGAAGLILCQSASDLLSLLLCFLVLRGTLRDSSCARGGCSDARTASQSGRHS